MSHIEIEYKTLLNKDEFNRLSVLFSHVKPIVQTNYYFDTPNNDIKKKHMSLRIRTLANRGELTLKTPKTIGNMEHNQQLSLDEAKSIVKSGQIPQGSVFDILKKEGIDVTSLHSFGHLTTTRQETKTDIGIMALDNNHYATIKDYELELEVDDAEKGKRDFDHFLKKHKITFKYAKSKVARFASTLK